MITRIEPVESWGKWALDIRIGDQWQHFHTDYRCVVDRMAEKIEAASRPEQVLKCPSGALAIPCLLTEPHSNAS